MSSDLFWIEADGCGGCLVCRCQDKNGSFTVETTAWEDNALASTISQQRKGAQVDHWTPSGQDGKSIPRFEM